MTAYIAIADATDQITLHEGADLVAAIQGALDARGIAVTATEVLPLGGTRYIRRDADPKGFWIAQMTQAIGDNEEWGHGDTPDEATAMARPELDE